MLFERRVFFAHGNRNSMKQVLTVFKGGYAFIVAGCAAVAVLALAGIYNEQMANKNLDALLRHPFRVALAAYEIRRSLAHMNLALERLPDRRPADLRKIRMSLERERVLLEEKLDVVEQHYLGSPVDVANVRTLTRQLFAAQETLLARVDGDGAEARNSSTRARSRALSDAIDTALSGDILTSVFHRVESFSGRSFAHFSMIGFLYSGSAILAGIVLCAVMILLRRRDEEKLRREKIMSVVFENSGTVSILYDTAVKKVEYVSDNAPTVLGLEVPVLQGGMRALFDCCVPRDSRLEELLEGGGVREPARIEIPLRNPRTGALNTMLLCVEPVRKNGHNPCCVIAVSDITDIRRSQQALRDALLQAQHAEKAKSAFLSNMSHEIRTPLNAVMGMTTIALHVPDDRARVEDCLRKIAASSRHLLMLVNDVLDMSKIESGAFSLDREEFHLPLFVENLLSIIQPQMQAKNHEFTVKYARVRHETFIGDRLRLNQILLNLLSNAIKFTPPHGRIGLMIREAEDARAGWTRLRFLISDNGIGMNGEFRKILFQPFTQEHAVSGAGTGLGMSITRNLVLLMRGVIRVRSAPGKGSTFMVELPLELAATARREDIPARPCDHAAESHPARNGTETPDRLDGVRFLLAEDNPINQEIMVELLRMAGAEVDAALNGEEAVRIFAAAPPGRYAAVLMDVQMPVLDGYEATRRIRALNRPDAGNIPIIAITANAFGEDVAAAARAGMTAHLSKPVDPSLLYQTLAKLI